MILRVHSTLFHSTFEPLSGLAVLEPVRMEVLTKQASNLRLCVGQARLKRQTKKKFKSKMKLHLNGRLSTS